MDCDQIYSNILNVLNCIYNCGEMCIRFTFRTLYAYNIFNSISTKPSSFIVAPYWNQFIVLNTHTHTHIQYASISIFGLLRRPKYSSNYRNIVHILRYATVLGQHLSESFWICAETRHVEREISVRFDQEYPTRYQVAISITNSCSTNKSHHFQK